MRFVPLLPLLLVSVCFLGNARADVPRGAVQASVDSESARPSRWGFVFGVTANSSFHESSDPDRQEYLQIATIPTFQISEDWKASFSFVQNKDLRGERELSINNSTAGLSFAGRSLNPYLKLSGSMSAAVPLSTNARDNESLITAFALAPKLSLDLSRTRLSALSLSYGLVLNRGFHRYETKATGGSNYSYRAVQIAGASLSLSDAVSFSAAGAYSSRWTYAGNMTTIFEIGAGANYQLTKAFALELAVGTNGNMLKDDGRSSNIAVFDKNTSEMSLGATYTF